MAACEVCGNNYDKPITVSVQGGETRNFDSFECAIHALAPTCAHCGIKVIGHGIESGDDVYCCVYCAREAGIDGAADRVWRPVRGPKGRVSVYLDAVNDAAQINDSTGMALARSHMREWTEQTFGIDVQDAKLSCRDAPTADAPATRGAPGTITP